MATNTTNTSAIDVANSLLSLPSAITPNPTSTSPSQEVTPSPPTLRRSPRDSKRENYAGDLDVSLPTKEDLPNKKHKVNHITYPQLKPRKEAYDQNASEQDNTKSKIRATPCGLALPPGVNVNKRYICATINLKEDQIHLKTVGKYNANDKAATQALIDAASAIYIQAKGIRNSYIQFAIDLSFHCLFYFRLSNNT